jgi:hypothetical protein
MGYLTSCWLWQWTKSSLGYSQIGRNSGHRHYYEKKHGAVYSGLELDHLCRVPSCVNPDHLEPVTHAENMRRSVKAKLSHDQVKQIRALFVALGNYKFKTTVIANEYGIERHAVTNIVARRTWGTA